MHGVQKGIVDIPNQLDKGKKQSIFLFKIKLSWLLQISRAFIFQLQTGGNWAGCRCLGWGKVQLPDGVEEPRPGSRGAPAQE